MKIGIATSVFSNYSIHEAVRIIAEAGYDCIDIWGGRPHIYRKDYSPEELRALRSEIESRGMTVSSFMPAFYRYPHNLCSPNPEVVRDSLDYVYQCMDNAAELGASILLVCPPRLLFGQEVNDGWELLANALRLICDRVYQYPLKVSLEPVNKNVFDLINNVSDAKRMITYVGDEHLGVTLDSGHLYLSDETIEQALSSVGNYLFQVHINDNDGKNQQNLVPGEGTFNFEEFFTQLKKIGYNGVVSAELTSDYGQQIQPAVEKTIQLLKMWLK